MVRRFFTELTSFFNNLVHRPFQIFIICFAFIFIGLVLDGTMLKLWGLHRDSKELEYRMKEVSKKTDKLEFKIKMAQDPGFMELQARDRFELVEAGDLIFVFSDN